MSYARENDKYDNGYLSRFRERLEGAVRVELGDNEAFHIFQDRTHIQTGDPWEERIEHYLSAAELFIPILTPHFFKSKWCQREFECFWKKQLTNSNRPPILPIYYIRCDQIRDYEQYASDSMEYLLATYQPVYWLELRHQSLSSLPAKRAIGRIASHIKDTLFGRDRRLSSFLPGSSGVFRSPPISNSDQDFGPPLDIRLLPRARSLVGRRSHLAQIIAGLTRQRGRRIVRIEGPEGMGKTVLAAEAIHRIYVDDKFRDGIAVVPCTRIPDTLTLLRNVLARFDPQRRMPVQSDEEGLIAEARRLLIGKDAVVVLDDLEVNQETVRIIDALHSIGLALLITTKNSPSLRYGVRIPLTSLPRHEAFDLLTERLERG